MATDTGGSNSIGMHSPDSSLPPAVIPSFFSPSIPLAVTRTSRPRNMSALPRAKAAGYICARRDVTSGRGPVSHSWLSLHRFSPFSNEEEGNEGTCGAWLSDVSAALVTRGLVVCLTPTRGYEILAILSQT
jgi:hypothetical protein